MCDLQARILIWVLAGLMIWHNAAFFDFVFSSGAGGYRDPPPHMQEKSIADKDRKYAQRDTRDHHRSGLFKAP